MTEDFERQHLFEDALVQVEKEVTLWDQWKDEHKKVRKDAKIIVDDKDNFLNYDTKHRTIPYKERNREWVQSGNDLPFKDD